MGELGQRTIAQLLEALDHGDADALDALFPLVYDELRLLARRQRRHWSGAATLNTTAIVHELYLKLAGQSHVHVAGRAHFFALSARAMRQLLSNHARDRRTRKRGGHLEARPLDDSALLVAHDLSIEQHADELVALDAALARLEQLDPRRSHVVECRFYGGMTVEDTALALGTSERTVKRDWAVAQAWLHREMKALLEVE